MSILKKQCEVCGLKLESLYQKQLDNNFKEHMRTHPDGGQDED